MSHASDIQVVIIVRVITCGIIFCLLQFDTHPHGTVRLMLSDDFANKTFSTHDLPYCNGSVPCEYLDPWDLNWPIGEYVNILTHSWNLVFLSVPVLIASYSRPIGLLYEATVLNVFLVLYSKLRTS